MSALSVSPTLRGDDTPKTKSDDGSGSSMPFEKDAISSSGPHPNDVEKALQQGKPEAEPSFEVTFSGDEDPRSPKSLSTLRKWIIVLIISSTSLCVACTSSLYTGTYAQVMEEFGSDPTVTTLGLSMFVVGLGLSPMVLAPLSEVRRGTLWSNFRDCKNERTAFSYQVSGGVLADERFSSMGVSLSTSYRHFSSLSGSFPAQCRRTFRPWSLRASLMVSLVRLS